MKKKLPVLTILALLGVQTAGSDEGRIPIFNPTTITSPGHHILTRNISIGGGSAITIASSDVTVDLNGLTILSSARVT